MDLCILFNCDIVWFLIILHQTPTKQCFFHMKVNFNYPAMKFPAGWPGQFSRSNCSQIPYSGRWRSWFSRLLHWSAERLESRRSPNMALVVVWRVTNIKQYKMRKFAQNTFHLPLFILSYVKPANFGIFFAYWIRKLRSASLTCVGRPLVIAFG